MKFSCSKDVLDKALQHISRIVTVRQSMPVLSNVLLETDEKILRMSGTDLEITVNTHIPATIESEGTFTVPAKVFQEFVHQNPDDQITFTLESFELLCKSPKVEARISGIDPEEYPTLPKIENTTTFRLPLHEFVEAVKKVVIACAADQARPILTGVYIQFIDDKAVLAATDSFRLVEKKITIVPVKTETILNIPSRTIQEIIRISSTITEDIDLELEVSEQQVLCRIKEIELYSRLIVGNFPKYQAIIPSKFQATAGITTAEFIQALRLSYVFSTSGVANVMLEVTEDGALTVTSYGSGRGSTKNTIYALLEEGFTPLKAAFNAKFLLDALQAANSTHMQLQFSGPISPLVLATEEADYTQLVMPIRLDA